MITKQLLMNALELHAQIPKRASAVNVADVLFDLQATAETLNHRSALRRTVIEVDGHEQCRSLGDPMTNRDVYEALLTGRHVAHCGDHGLVQVMVSGVTLQAGEDTRQGVAYLMPVSTAYTAQVSDLRFLDFHADQSADITALIDH